MLQQLLLNFTWHGIVASTATIFVTTLDDSIWLIPFVFQHNHGSLHGITFISTLFMLTILCCIFATIIQKGLLLTTTTTNNSSSSSSSSLQEMILQGAGALICWSLAGYFYYKKVIKRKRQQGQQEQNVDDTEYGSINQSNNNNDDNTNIDSTTNNNNDNIKEQKEQDTTSNSSDGGIQIGTIMSLTVLGFLDEISYFPAIVVGKVFTFTELCIGSILASLLILLLLRLLTLSCSTFQPIIMDMIDRIPLYGIIGVFAILLTVQCIWNVIFFC